MTSKPEKGVLRKWYCKMCSSFYYVCCEPRLEDLHESSSDENGGEPDHHQQRQDPADQHDPGRLTAEPISPAKGGFVKGQEGIGSPGSDAISGTGSPTAARGEKSRRAARDRVEKHKRRSDAEEGRDARNGVIFSNRARAAPLKTRGNKSPWSDDILEGFLYSTLVQGGGLAVDKLGSDGKGKKTGVRVLSYDPETMMLNWVSTGLRRKTGSMLAKEIDEVLCDGTSLTIYCYPARLSPAAGTEAGVAGPSRRRSLSPFRRSSSSAPPPLTAPQGRRIKAFQTSHERDARILKELLMFVRRKAVLASLEEEAGAGEGAGVGARASSMSPPARSTAAVSPDDGINGGGGGGSSVVGRGRSRLPGPARFSQKRGRSV